jgi:UDP-2,3-diacylglucosamine pyrophosphatase LpxH
MTLAGDTHEGSAREGYAKVYVVSDLHLGGYTGERRAPGEDWSPTDAAKPVTGDEVRSFRIFRQARALAWLIDRAGSEPRVALVLNGDIVDFLAAPEAHGFNPEGAKAELERIMDDPEQADVWRALQRFVARDQGDLVLVLGNHDVELALHDVNEALLERLTSGQRALRRRIVFCFDGAGFGCRVGNARVLAVHGNSVDPWNEVSYQQLAEYARARQLGTRLPEFRVNAGSTLVVEHMNKIKRRFQWIDLLKPETEGAALVTAALDTESGAPIKLMFDNLFRRNLRMTKATFVSESVPSGAPSAPYAALASASGTLQPTRPLDDVLREALQHDADGASPQRYLDAGDDGALSALDVAPGLFNLKVLRRSLRETLARYLPKDASFSPYNPDDDTYRRLDDASDPEVDFLIAGHTHLERCLRRKKGRGMYYNTGTWIQLVELPVAALRNDETFAPVKSALEQGSIEVLEKALSFDGQPAQPLSKNKSSVVIIEQTSDGRIRGTLNHVVGSQHSFALEPVPACESFAAGPRGVA